MKILIALSAIFAVSAARVVITAEGPSDIRLLGDEECTWGPSYWCENLKTAAGCNATKHCIKAVWKDMTVPEDTDTVCGVCKDVVNQAREQLESNQTVEDLRAVFEGSCKLIRIEPIVKECITIVNQFIPDLVETLASEMNPSVVCSLAGLCNSPRIDKLLEEYEHNKPQLDAVNTRSLEKDELEPDECSKCYTVAKHMEHKLSNTPRDKMLHQMLNLCAELGSFTDACSATVLTYFETIRTHLKDNFNAENICHLSGQCSAKFHKHEDTDTTLKVEIRPLSSVGMVDVSDDLPCKLCEQLVGHLRDLLVANTTEAEFQQVLDGLCKQTHSFASECTSVVDEYYPEIYEYLTKQLNSNGICQMTGLCPAPDKSVQNEPIWPLVPNDAAEIGMRIFQDAKTDLKNNEEEELSKSEVETMQLPIERLLPFPVSDVPVEGSETCAVCEYVLHFIQEAMTNPINEEKVKLAIHDVCEKLPESVRAQCTGFVDTYGDVVMAILAQEIDPSQVCPMIHLCPSDRLLQVFDSVPEKYMLANENSKPSCPLCLLAVSQIYNVIKNNKTEANIEAELDKLCLHLPRDLKGQCMDLVKGYSKELVELLLADLTPQEVCAYLKMCDPAQNLGLTSVSPVDKDGEILTNEIPDSAISPEVSIETEKSPTCMICELAMHYVDNKLGSDKGRNNVENAVRGVCKHLPKSVSNGCNNFVNKHGDQIIDVITKDVSPKLVCTMIRLCILYTEELKVTNEMQDSAISPEVSIETEKNPTCVVCELAMHYVGSQLGSDKGRNKIENAVHGVCNHLPKSLTHACNNFVNNHGDQIIDKISQHVSPNQVCSVIGLCAKYMEELTVTNEMQDSAISPEVSIETEKNPTCVVCELAMHYVGSQLGSDKGRNKIENAVHGVCNHLPKSLTHACNNFVNNHGDQIIDKISQHVSPNQVCSVIGLCAKYMEELTVTNEMSDSAISPEVSIETEKSPTCMICELAMHYVDNKLGSDKGRNNVENAVRGVCKHLPKSVSNGCNNFVNNHGDKIIDIITKDVSPKLVCTMIRLCLLYTEELTVTNEMQDSAISPEVSIETEKNPTCIVCELAMHYIDSELGSDKGRNKVENTVHGVCNHLPKSLSHACNNFVNNHGDQIIDKITHDVSPKQVCTMISLCAKYMEEFEVTNEMQDSAISPEVSIETEKNPTCVVCELAMHYVGSQLGSDKGRNKIENAVHGVCNHLPKSLTHACNNFVNNHGDQIIDKISQHVSPNQVCSVIGLCAKYMEELTVSNEIPESAISPEMSIETEKNPTCIVCELAMHYVDSKIGSDKGRNNVENAVRGVCNHLPKSVSRECNNFVNNHGDQIIDVITKDVSPKQVCTMIGLCALYTEELKANVVECGLCKAVISVIENLLADPKVDDSIKNVVSKACKHVPAKLKDKCTSMINIYGQSIINLVQRHTHGKTICGKIGLCAPADYSMLSLESSRMKRSYEKDPTKRCTWGSAYWCSTTAAAVECKAVEHCRELVWKADFAPPKQIA